MLVVGLTGGIATGKSTVSTLIKKHSSAPVIDADVIAREVVEPGSPALEKIRDYFGSDILLADGTLDRAKLGRVIFGDEEKRKVLNGIVHPAVRRKLLTEIIKAWIGGYSYCVIDVPLLIETGLYRWVGKVVLVSCSQHTQLQRLMARDDSTEQAAISRISSQIPIHEKTSYADIVINNDGSAEELEQKIRTDLLRTLNNEARWFWLFDWLCPPFGVLSACLTLFIKNFKRSVFYGGRGTDRLRVN